MYTKDGEKVLDLGKTLISTFEVSLSETHISEEFLNFSSSFGQELSIDISGFEIDEELLKKFMPAKVLAYRLKQNKIHRKKRINKKWAKKYGHTLDIYVG